MGVSGAETSLRSFHNTVRGVNSFSNSVFIGFYMG